MWSPASTFCLALGLMLQSPASPAWDITRSEDGDFAVSLPGKSASLTGGSGGPRRDLEILLYSCSAGGCEYTVRRVKAAESVRPDEVVARLDAWRGGLVKQGARIVKETPITLDGVVGHDVTYNAQEPKGDGVATWRTRRFLKGSYSYELTVASTADGALPDDATRFLSSLTFEALARSARAAARSRPDPGGKHEGEAVRSAPRSEGRAANRGTQVRILDTTPEQALGTFLLALAAQDEAALRAVTLPDKEFAWLLKDRPPPATPEILSAMRAGFARTPFRRLAAGDRIKMPGGRFAVIKPDDTRAGRVVLMPEGAPMPARLEEVGGHWKVFPRTFIAGRKAAGKRGQERSSGAGARPGH